MHMNKNSAAMAIELLSSSRGYHTAAAAVEVSPAAATAAAAKVGMRSGGSFSDLRQLLSSMRHHATSPLTHAHPAAAAGGSNGAAAAAMGSPGLHGSSAVWWRQRRSQVLVAVLLLLSVANLAVSHLHAAPVLGITWTLVDI
jgi:hypothetical protein